MSTLSGKLRKKINQLGSGNDPREYPSEDDTDDTEDDTEDEDSEENEESKNEHSKDEKDEDVPADILEEKEKEDEDEEEYQPIEESSEEEKSDIEEEEEEDEEEGLYVAPDEEEEIVEEDVPEDDMPDIEGDDGQVFEDTKKKASSRKKEPKRRLFPFIQKKKRLVQLESREFPEFYHLEVRESAKEIFRTSMSIPEKEVLAFEKVIFNAAARKSIGKEELTVDSIDFKIIYLEIVRYFIGVYGKLKKNEILGELREDNYGFNSVMFKIARDLEEKEQEKIKNPDDVTEDPNYPCPLCKGIKTKRARVVDRGGDEATSLRLWCADKLCSNSNNSWRIGG